MCSATRGLVVFSLSLAAFGCEGFVDRLETLHPNSGGAGLDESADGQSDDDGDGATDAAVSLNPQAPPAAQGGGSSVAAPAPQPAPLDVTLEVRIFTLVVGGSAKATAEFSWDTAGSSGANVVIQMKSSVTNPEWTPLLSGLPASDVGARYELPLVRQTLWFRAVAADGAATGTSNIVRFD